MLRTRSPLLFKCIATPEKPFDLHVLTTPPAFILSQDQTLRKKRATNPSDSWTTYWGEPEGSPRINLEYMLIGGPNQSHKVNFKEPLPLKGKISTRTFAFYSVNLFPEIIGKNYKGTLTSRSLRSLRSPSIWDNERRERGTWELHFLNQVLSEGSAI